MNDYNRIRQTVMKAYPQKGHEFHTKEAKKIYDRTRTEKDDVAKAMAVQMEIKTLREITTKRKAENLMFFIKASESAAKNPDRIVEDSAVVANPDGDKKPEVAVAKKICRAQNEAEVALNEATKIVADLATMKDVNDPELKKALKSREAAKAVFQSKFKNAERQRKFQHKRKILLQDMIEKDPAMKAKLCIRDKCGRPSATDIQAGLLKAIVDLSMRGAGAHERRQMDALSSCKTLDDLTRELKLLGYNLSRSGIYLRLIPRNWATHEGKRHVTTVSVKLKRAENEEHRHHIDTMFARATYNNLLQLASLLGSHDVVCLSQDDKAKVPLGIPAANKQATIVMNMEYRIKLPDHDFVVAAGHKLIPSVIAGLEVSVDKLDNAVSYSGPTFIAIRSGKHDSSVAGTHAADLRYLYDTVQSFKNLLYRQDGTVKPVLMVFVDGGPDENPRYKETIKAACANFIHFQFDAMYVSTQAPGRSAYNPVERRMAPLSRQLAGLILPHDIFGSHLNSKGETVDEDVEKANFQKAGETLAEVWNETVIDNFPVIAQWRGGNELVGIQCQSQEWLANHVRASQYFLQIVKCTNEECCSPMVSALRTILPNGFLPAPVAVSNDCGLQADATSSTFLSLFQSMTVNLKPNGFENNQTVPYDYFCPSVSEHILKRTCNACKLYFPSTVMLVQHKQALHPKLKISEIPKCRPVRIAARRQRELMAIIAAGNRFVNLE